MSSDIRYWLLINGAAAGPFSSAYVQLQCLSGKVSSDTLACPVGTEAWQPLHVWFGRPEAAATPPIFAASTQPQCSSLFGIKPSVVLSAVTTYALYVSPAFFLIAHTCSFWTPAPYKFESPYFRVEVLLMIAEAVMSLLVTVLLFLGGVHLRQRRMLGAKFLRIGFMVNTLGAIGYVVISTLLGVMAETDVNVDHFAAESEISAAMLVVMLAMAIAGIAAAAFQIPVWIWLVVNSESLPLQR